LSEFLAILVGVGMIVASAASIRPVGHTGEFGLAARLVAPRLS
jgi:hypothetical protein